MTRRRRSLVVHSLLFGATLSIWAALGFALFTFSTTTRNQMYFQDLSGMLMQQLETSVDFAVINSIDFLEADTGTCEATTRNDLLNLVMGMPNLRNIIVTSPTSSCAAFGDDAAGAHILETSAQWTAAKNPDFRFGPIELMGKTFLGILWDFHPERKILLILNLSNVLFVALPPEFRDAGRVNLQTGSAHVKEFTGPAAPLAEGSVWTIFEQSGERYPLRIEIQLNPDIYDKWRRDIPITLAIIWIALGMLVSALAVLAFRNKNPALDVFLDALDLHEIIPYFQPIVDIRTGKAVGCEALARWIKPNGDFVSPAKFIPLLEDNGLNNRLFETFLEHAARDLGAELNNRPSFYVSFNVTPCQLEDPNFSDSLLATAARLDLKPSQLCLEITERQEVLGKDTTAQMIDTLFSAGFRIAIDDAGTGQNGLSAIQSYKATTLKIDKYFIDRIADDPRARIMIDMLVSVSRRYGMTTVAEGVEDQQQLDILSEAGVNAIQGFFFSRPLPADSFLAWLNKEWQTTLIPSERNPRGEFAGGVCTSPA